MCHELGLAVHPYPLKDDFLVWSNPPNPIEEHKIFVNKKIDGIFTEFPHMTHSVFNDYKSMNEFPLSYIESHPYQTHQNKESFLQQ